MELEKMELDALDLLAWLKIIQFLDEQSRLQCRLLSRTVKEYVDYMGLQPTVCDSHSQSLKNGAWEAFVNTPDIRFQSVRMKVLPDNEELGLNRLHEVDHLQLEAFIQLNLLDQWDWTRNITALSLMGDCMNSGRFELKNEIWVKYLRKLKISFSDHQARIRWTQEVENLDAGQIEKARNGISNTISVLKKIRSSCMTSITVDSYAPAVGNYELELKNALREFVQSHYKTLEILRYFFWDFAVYSGYAEDLEKFEHIPLKLKHLDVDFLSLWDKQSNSEWLKMITKLDKLETFTSTGTNGQPSTSFGGLAKLNEHILPNFMQTICDQNYRTLRVVKIQIDQDLSGRLDFAVFGSCMILEEIYVTMYRSPFCIRNMELLPDTVLVVDVHYQTPRKYAGLTIHIQKGNQPTRFDNLRRLNELTVRPQVEFWELNDLLQFARAILRLRKLDILNLGNLGIRWNSHYNNEDRLYCQDFFKALGAGREINPSYGFRLKPCWNTNAKLTNNRIQYYQHGRNTPISSEVMSSLGRLGSFRKDLPQIQDCEFYTADYFLELEQSSDSD